MDGFKMIGRSLCITVLITSIFSMLIPKLKLKSAVNTAVSLFFLVCLASPFLSGNFSFSIPSVFDFYEEAPPAVSETVSRQFVSLAEAKLEKILSDSLKKSGTEAKEIEVKINIDENDCISINKLEIVLGREDSAKEKSVISKTAEETGVIPLISYQ